MRGKNCCIALIGCLSVLPGVVEAQFFFDDFDSYASGSTIAGQGGWETWGSDPGVDTQVTNIVSNSPPNSLGVSGTADIIHRFAGATSGTWHVKVQTYVPSSQLGDLYFSVLNRYDGFCASAAACDWSVQVRMSAAGGVVESAGGNNNPSSAPPLPLITNAWAEIMVEINLDMNTYTVYYNGTPLDTLPYTVTGDINIAALNLFSSASTESYIDDVLLDTTTAGAVRDLTSITSPEARYLVNMGKPFGETVERAYNVPNGIHDIASAGGNAGYYWQMCDGETADGYLPNTYGGLGVPGVGDYIGYRFKQPVRVNHVEFWNKVYGDGGTFDAEPVLSYQLGGISWYDSPSLCAPGYQSTFGAGVNAYTFTPASGPFIANAIRLWGETASSPSGDSDGFVGVAELRVFGTMLAPRPLAIESDLTGRVPTTVNLSSSQYLPANLIDDDLDSYDTTVLSDPGFGRFDLVQICFDEPQRGITAVGVVFKFFSDGGWYDESVSPFRILYSTNGSFFVPVSDLHKSTYADDYLDLAALAWNVESGYLLTFAPLEADVLCLQLEGDGGGTADPDPGTDTEGFLAITELEVFQVPEIFADGLESSTTSAWSATVP
jgi:hypothetical protein